MTDKITTSMEKTENSVKDISGAMYILSRDSWSLLCWNLSDEANTIITPDRHSLLEQLSSLDSNI